MADVVEALLAGKWTPCEIAKENPHTYECRFPQILGALNKPIVITRKRWQVRINGKTPPIKYRGEAFPPKEGR